MQSILTKDQKKFFGWKFFSENGTPHRIKAEVRYDDCLGNGHNSFAITATIEDKRKNGRWVFSSGGCCHEEVSKHFPELYPFIKWHLMNSDGPMHYVANTVFFAGNRDCYGKQKDQPLSYDTALRFGDFPIRSRGLSKGFIFYLLSLGQEQKDGETIVSVPHRSDPDTYGPKFTFRGYPCEWYQCPFDSEREAVEFLEALRRYPLNPETIPTSWSAGKERELDKARAAAIWPEATDAELCQDPESLKAALLNRLPALVAEFKKDVESLGFVF